MTDAEKLAQIAKIVSPRGFGSADLALADLNAVRRIVGVPEVSTSGIVAIYPSGGGISTAPDVVAHSVD